LRETDERQKRREKAERERDGKEEGESRK